MELANIIDLFSMLGKQNSQEHFGKHAGSPQTATFELVTV